MNYADSAFYACKQKEKKMDKEPVVAVKSEFSIIDENTLKLRIYTIRGVKAMLDADLAEIYGYTTKAFNQQVKNNVEKFDEDFRFQLSRDEYREILGSKFLTLEQGKYSKSCPYAFTEQGIYMLMTVLKGEQATVQSKALIRLFKKMKDYIASENRNFLEYDGIAQIAVQTEKNTRDIVTIQSNLQKVMENFIDPSTAKHFLILNGQKLEADVAYSQIYAMAKKSVMIVDNYVDVKTLDLLRNVEKNVSVLIVSDQYGKTRLTERVIEDFKIARPDVKLDDLKPAGNAFHDRYIYLDYGLSNEKLFHCGASSKDAGGKITTIMQVENPKVYHEVFKKFM